MGSVRIIVAAGSNASKFFYPLAVETIRVYHPLSRKRGQEKGTPSLMPKLKIAGACFLMLLVWISVSAPVRADDTAKDEETLEKASTVLQAMLDAKTVPQSLLVKADCVIVLPSVKKGAFIIGGTGGRGPMICRSGKKFFGRWGAPAMYSIGGTSIGLQVGGTASDFVLLVMSPPALDKLLEGKSK